MRTPSRQLLLTTPFSRILAYLPFALPLIYVRPFLGSYTNELLHAAIVIVAGIMCLLLLLSARPKLHGRQPTWRLVLFGLITVMVFSLAFAKDRNQAIVGIDGDYQGLLLQLASIALGYYASSFISDKNYWRHVADIGGLVCIGSLAISAHYLIEGYRLSGFLLHDTGICFYAAITLAANLLASQLESKWTLWRQVGSLASILAIVFSASRIGLFATFAILLMLYITTLKLRIKALVSAALLLTLVMAISLTPLPVKRLTDPSRVDEGISYRLQLYGWSLRQSHFSLFGAGSSSVNEALKPRADVAIPAVIQHTLKTGYPLWYSHDQFIDIYIEYGVVGLILFCYLLFAAIGRSAQELLAVRNLPVAQQVPILMVGSVLIVAVCNLAVNTPSIELASIMFIGIFASLRMWCPVANEVRKSLLIGR